MRLAMFGYQSWGHKTLETLIDSEHDVVLVVTHPPSEHVYESIWDDNVAELAQNHDIPVIFAHKPDKIVIEQVRKAAPDLIIANNWRTWMPEELYNLPPLGTLNIHDSLLPKFTGFSPVIWSLISGQDQTGLTIHKMDSGLDTGDILIQKSIPISETATGTELVQATIDLISPALHEALTALTTGTAQFRKQDASQRSFFHKRSQEDSAINWNIPAADLERFIRALSDPYPAAYTYFEGERIEILSANISECCYGGTPGRIFIEENGGMVIVAGVEAFRGTSRGLVIHQIRTEMGHTYPAISYLTRGKYLRSYPEPLLTRT